MKNQDNFFIKWLNQVVFIESKFISNWFPALAFMLARHPKPPRFDGLPNNGHTVLPEATFRPKKMNFQAFFHVKKVAFWVCQEQSFFGKLANSQK